MTAVLPVSDRPAHEEAGTLEPARAVPVLAGAAARVVGDWPAGWLEQDEILSLLGAGRFVLHRGTTHQQRLRGVAMLLDWLASQDGETWQERWLASGADAAGKGWRDLTARWLRDRGEVGVNPVYTMWVAVTLLFAADVVRPSLRWLLSCPTSGRIVAVMSQTRDPEGFGRLRELADADPSLSARGADVVMLRAATVLAAKGGRLADITVGDVAEFMQAERDFLRQRTVARSAFYRLLRDLGVFGPHAPQTLRAITTSGQPSTAALIDRYDITCRPVRDLLVDYLRERQPGLDFSTMNTLSHQLGKLFWADLERHHPGIDSLDLPIEVATAWKLRMQSRATLVDDGHGGKTTVMVPRISQQDCLAAVRAFYLDLAEWALEDPARWSRWAVRCPIKSHDLSRRKNIRHRKARMDARTRERLPVLPVLTRSVDQRRHQAAHLLTAALATTPGQQFTVAGTTLLRVDTRTSRTWASDPATGRRRDIALEEEYAFWAWAAVEVLRATGIRIEEMLELTHHSLVQYRLPSTGELVPLLQIAPSKTDAERLLLVSPELADVLSAIITRIRDESGAVPLISVYDRNERLWTAPAPALFQRHVNGERRPFNVQLIRKLFLTTLAHTGLKDSATGGPLHYTPHDFRRLFITDAILGGLPPHIAQVIAGHADINTTLGYKAIYPDEAITAHLAFLARRRALRPTEEYRIPSDDEWQEFLGHFERRKVSTGNCGRPFATPCIHEHACVRCPMLWPDPAQRPRLAELRDNLVDRIAEAQREGWQGDVDGLQVSLAVAQEKLAQIDRRAPASPTVDLGMPGSRRDIS